MELYHSPWEAYPFLSDAPEDLRCDFELLTDGIASHTGFLRSQVTDEALKTELLQVCELVYHANPTLRTHFTVSPGELRWLSDTCERLRAQSEGRCSRFVLPQGCPAACIAHLLRVRCKELVRLLYRHTHQGHPVEPALLDFANLLSDYFFLLALVLNEQAGQEEVEFISRNY